MRRRSVNELPTFRTVSPDSGWPRKKERIASTPRRSCGFTPQLLVITFCGVIGIVYLISLGSGSRSGSGSESRSGSSGGGANDEIAHSPSSPYGKDTDGDCPRLARLGECADNRPETLSRCPQSCHSIAGISIDALSESEALEDAARGFAHFLHRGDEVVDDDDGEGGTAICEDDSPDCAEMALEGACVDNPTEMLTRCRRSCLACFGGEPATD